VAPVNRRAERLLAGQHRARATRQQAKTIDQPSRDLLGGQQPDPRRRELDRQRDPVELMADLGHRGGVGIVDREIRADLSGTLDEQPHGVGLGDRCDRLGRLFRRGQ
jgi:hypothetical protein